MKLSKVIKSMNKCFSKGILVCLRNTIRIILRTLGYFIFYAGDTDNSRKSLNKVLDKHYLHRYGIYFLIIIFIGFFSFLVVGPFILKTPTTFNVTAVTEEVKVTTHDVPMSSWPVKDVELSTDCPDEKRGVKYPQFTGSIKLNPSSQITFTRIGLGKLTVKMYNNNNKAVGELYDEEDEYKESLTNCAFFNIVNISERDKIGETVLLPITGDITVGNEIRFITQSNIPVLREGKITILDRSFVLGENYSLEPNTLETGDRFEIEEPSVPSQGFILVNEGPAINLVFSAKGYRGIIKRYQAEDFELRNSYWSKLYHDESLSLAWIFVIILFNVIRVYLRFLVNGNEKNYN